MRAHVERHRSDRGGWLRAAVLGADDGIVSITCLMLGVAATQASSQAILVAGLAGLVAGATSMATGEFVSVSTQRDAEAADIAREKHEQVASPGHELDELKGIYVGYGLEEPLALQVAQRLMEVDALGSHLRDELGLLEQLRAKPVMAASVSAASFAVGAALPLLVIWLTPQAQRIPALAIAAVFLLAGLGALGGKLGGASPWRAAVRVCIGGGLAMAASTAIGRLVGMAGL